MDKSQQKKKINKGGIIYILTGTNQIENLFTNGNDMKNLIVWFKCIKNKKKSRKDEHFMTNRIKKQTLVVDSISGMDDTSSVNVESLNIIFTLKNILKPPKCISLDIINSLISNEKCYPCTQRIVILIAPLVLT